MFCTYTFILSPCLHRSLEVYGNPVGCVQVPDSVTWFDTWVMYDETARCGDNCTELTVYVPSDGVCVQCPDGMRALGVGALNCSVLSPARCSLRARAYMLLQCVAMLAHEMRATHVLQCVTEVCCIVCCSSVVLCYSVLQCAA